MIRVTLLLSIIAVLTGCTGIAPTSAQAGAVVASAPVRTVPVFVIPNCRSLSGAQHCYWIEPRGYQPSAPTKTSASQVKGIAL
jgi:hypothetical protein